MSDNIEHLKKNKIRLPQLGGAEPDVTEAFSGADAPLPGPIDPDEVRDAVIEALKTVFDPEIPVNVYDLGLVYRVDVTEHGHVEVQMTLTAPACPVAGAIVRDVADRVGKTPGVATCHVELVWDPPWTPDRMTEAARLELGLL